MMAVVFNVGVEYRSMFVLNERNVESMMEDISAEQYNHDSRLNSLSLTG